MILKSNWTAKTALDTTELDPTMKHKAAGWIRRTETEEDLLNATLMMIWELLDRHYIDHKELIENLNLLKQVADEELDPSDLEKKRPASYGKEKPKSNFEPNCITIKGKWDVITPLKIMSVDDECREGVIEDIVSCKTEKDLLDFLTMLLCDLQLCHYIKDEDIIQNLNTITDIVNGKIDIDAEKSKAKKM